MLLPNWPSALCRRVSCCVDCPRLAVIGFGGYPSIPTMLAAAYLGLPTVIHEQNAVLGRANRLLAPRAQRIATGFPTTAGLRPADRARAVHTGNPVRPAILAVGEADYRAPEPGGPIELLILGGSQGARVLSEVMPPALAALPARLRKVLRISQQVRPEDFAAVAEIYRGNGLAADLNSFFDDVPERLARAHLAICRAGASTVAELAAAWPAGSADPLSVCDRRPSDCERPGLCRGRRWLGHPAIEPVPGRPRTSARKSAR